MPEHWLECLRKILLSRSEDCVFLVTLKFHCSHQADLVIQDLHFEELWDVVLITVQKLNRNSTNACFACFSLEFSIMKVQSFQALQNIASIVFLMKLKRTYNYALNPLHLEWSDVVKYMLPIEHNFFCCTDCTWQKSVCKISYCHLLLRLFLEFWKKCFFAVIERHILVISSS